MFIGSMMTVMNATHTATRTAMRSVVSGASVHRNSNMSINSSGGNDSYLIGANPDLDRIYLNSLNTLAKEIDVVPGVILYDKEFNAIGYYKNIDDALNLCQGYDVNQRYTYLDKIRVAVKTGETLMGYRWQSAAALIHKKDKTKICFNTIYDKMSFEAGRRDFLKLESGSYKLDGIVYPDCDFGFNLNNIQNYIKSLNIGDKVKICITNSAKQDKRFGSLLDAIKYLGIYDQKQAMNAINIINEACRKKSKARQFKQHIQRNKQYIQRKLKY